MKYRSNLLWPSALLLALLLAGCSGTAPLEPSSGTGQSTTGVQATEAATSGQTTTEAPQATATPAGAVISAENAASISEVASWRGHPCDFDLAFSPDSQNLVSTSCDQDTKVRVWNLASNTEQILDHEGAGFGATFSPDGSVLVVWSLGPKVAIYDFDTGTQTRTLEHSDYIFSADISPDGILLAGASGDGTVVLWDLATGNPLPVLNADIGEQYGSPLAVTGVSFSPDGAILASADKDGHVRIWDLASGSVVKKIAVDDVSSVMFSSDGSLLAAGVWTLDFYANPDQGKVYLYDVETQSKLHSFGGADAEYIRGFDISPDGSLLATVLKDGTIVLYDTASGDEIHRFAGGAEYVDVVVFSQDGRMIASEPRYADENRIEVWGINP